MARFNARGITSIREAGIDAADNELFRVLRAQGRLTLRCDLLWRVSEGSDVDSALRQIADMPAGGIASPYARLTGVKVFVDGRIADASSLRMTSQDLWAIVEASLRRSGGVGCHAVGDVAVRTVMDADLVAFSTDPLSCPIDELPDTEILLTLLGGRAVYDPARLMEEAGHDG